jgi:hypothetical protein
MPTILENIQTARENIAATLADITANPKPTYSVDGLSVSWADYFKMLTELDKSLRDAETMEDPYIIQSQVL